MQPAAAVACFTAAACCNITIHKRNNHARFRYDRCEPVLAGAVGAVTPRKRTRRRSTRTSRRSSFSSARPAIGPVKRPRFRCLTYQDAKKRGKLIAQVTQSRQMPPWKADKGDVAFRNERRLKDAEIAVLQQWVAAGMPEGDKNDLPAAADVCRRLAARQARPGRQDAQGVSRAGRGPGHLSQLRRRARPQGGQVGQGDRLPPQRRVGRASHAVLPRPDRHGRQEGAGQRRGRHPRGGMGGLGGLGGKGKGGGLGGLGGWAASAAKGAAEPPASASAAGPSAPRLALSPTASPIASPRAPT